MFSAFKSSSTLMIQGCTSDAGKTVMVAGLCRVLARRGHSVAPFKPQNMALNSAVTSDGGEIGRAQTLQAQACFIAPHTDFNPILLKPSSDTGAQVIVHGHAIDSMQADAFHDYKKVAMNAVLESHARLAEQYHSIIVEGAGSPAEINLREGDIANMGFAEEIDCPVVLVADIDRGGVFAHLVGTLELLSQSEQERITGFIINRFRGDIKLLESGLDWLEQRTGKPVLAVVPYLHDLYLDAEDAISTAQATPSEDSGVLKVAVPVLPRISNHTDFDALRLHPNVELSFVAIEAGCPQADLIILPGSKNVIADLTALKAAGWQQGLEKHLRYGGKLLGVCGGYQMLGQHISDPLAIESAKPTEVSGLGLLDLTTELKPGKKLANVRGQIQHAAFSEAEISGYEIHCGITQTSETPLIKLSNGQDDGACNSDNTIAGTYLHGLFDQAGSCNSLLAWAGLQQPRSVSLDQIREQQLNRLADCLEQCFDKSFLAALGPQNTLVEQA